MESPAKVTGKHSRQGEGPRTLMQEEAWYVRGRAKKPE